MPLVPSRQNFVERKVGHRLPESDDPVHRFAGIRRLVVNFRHDPGDRAAMAGDDDGFSALDLIEKLMQTRLRVGRPDFPHKNHLFENPTGHPDWSEHGTTRTNYQQMR